MQLSTAIASLVAPTSLALAASVPQADISKRDLSCAVTTSPRFTEARLANIIDEYWSKVWSISVDAGTTSTIGCIGGTGVFFSNMGTSAQLCDSKILSDELDSLYSTCYGHTPQSGAGDQSLVDAFQYFGDGYNWIVKGSAPC
jgi:hypothetical protein